MHATCGTHTIGMLPLIAIHKRKLGNIARGYIFSNDKELKPLTRVHT